MKWLEQRIRDIRGNIQKTVSQAAVGQNIQKTEALAEWKAASNDLTAYLRAIGTQTSPEGDKLKNVISIQQAQTLNKIVNTKQLRDLVLDLANSDVDKLNIDLARTTASEWLSKEGKQVERAALLIKKFPDLLMKVEPLNEPVSNAQQPSPVAATSVTSNQATTRGIAPAQATESQHRSHHQRQHHRHQEQPKKIHAQHNVTRPSANDATHQMFREIIKRNPGMETPKAESSKAAAPKAEQPGITPRSRGRG